MATVVFFVVFFFFFFFFFFSGLTLESTAIALPAWVVTCEVTMTGPSHAPGRASLLHASVSVTLSPLAVADTIEVGDPDVTVTELWLVLVSPSASVTVSATVNVPGFAYAWLASSPVAVAPSPKFHA